MKMKWRVEEARAFTRYAIRQRQDEFNTSRRNFFQGRTEQKEHDSVQTVHFP